MFIDISGYLIACCAVPEGIVCLWYSFVHHGECCVKDCLGICAYQTVRTGFNGLGPFGYAPDRHAGASKDECLLLNTTRIGDDTLGIPGHDDHLKVAYRLNHGNGNTGIAEQVLKLVACARMNGEDHRDLRGYELQTF